jgi:hypothetical protein
MVIEQTTRATQTNISTSPNLKRTPPPTHLLCTFTHRSRRTRRHRPRPNSSIEHIKQILNTPVEHRVTSCCLSTSLEFYLPSAALKFCLTSSFVLGLSKRILVRPSTFKFFRLALPTEVRLDLSSALELLSEQQLLVRVIARVARRLGKSKHGREDQVQKSSDERWSLPGGVLYILSKKGGVSCGASESVVERCGRC